ncbi:MAG: EAL domain-containing protein [Bacillota bacterium]|nr:EAL domain-containing protein [Bacillota bacterium]
MKRKKQILIVEDNELNRAILCEILSDDYQVLEAENGQEALDLLRQHRNSIALILLDVMMPVMDGYTFLGKVKEDPELALIPVIVMTQSDSEADEVSALAHGATDFVPKPYRPQVILHRVASLIKLRETAAMVNEFQYDRLTGLYSKAFFYQRVREQLAEHPEKKYSIICSNVENFKLYNDAFGVQAGDQLLRETADVFRAQMGEESICGHYRADRFVCLQEQNEKYAHRIAHGEDGRYACIVPEKNVVMKWGIYEINDPTIPVEGMCDRALLAVDSIKGQYNRYYALYDEEIRDRLVREQTITAAMETALEEGQFIVYFQPKYRLHDNRMIGAEALVRWIHPEWGFLSPGEFIPLFEKNGFIPRLDQYVWERVCAQLRDWKEKGYLLVPVSVNVSRSDVYQARLVDTLWELTQQYGVDPIYLHLEITESAYAENPGQIISTVEALRELGFPIEMDDFGSGYSSLNMLSQMKLDILKLDMKFIQNELAKPEEHSILNDVIRMAHRMRLSVVAEGVETWEQVKRLRAVGCDYVQGYYFAKPMPVQEFEQQLTAQTAQAIAFALEAEQEKRSLPTILLADEDAAYREKVCQAFDGVYQVLEEADPYRALDRLAACGGADAVILSMTLPDDGAAVLLQGLQKDAAFWKIPVLAEIPCGDALEDLPLSLEADDFLCKCHPIFDLQRRLDRLMDMVAAREREYVLQDEANRDYLTGLLNRRGLQAAMASLRKEDLPMAVCMFDLDNLKQINDTFGHDTGDRVIQAFADLLRRQTREEDIKCRYGGDEFVVLLKGLKDEETALKKGSEICRLFRERLEAENIHGACSGGIALCEVWERPSGKLIQRADQAMYQAKRENKGACCLWREQTANRAQK